MGSSMVLGWWSQSRQSPKRIAPESCANAECPETEQDAPPPSCALELVVVSGGVHEAEVLNGTYEQIGSYCDRPHFSKDGLPYNEPCNGYRENMQIWWHDGEWRIGNTGDHWCAHVSRPLDAGTHIFLLSLSACAGKRRPAFRARAYRPVTAVVDDESSVSCLSPPFLQVCSSRKLQSFAGGGLASKGSQSARSPSAHLH